MSDFDDYLGHSSQNYAMVPKEQKQVVMATSNMQAPSEQQAQDLEATPTGNPNTATDSSEPTTPIINPDDPAEKRYADLRSYSQKQLNDKDVELKQLKEQLKQRKLATLPKTKDELEAYAKERPDDYNVMLTMVKSQAIENDEALKEMLDNQQKELQELQASRGFTEVLKAHSDAEIVRDSLEFQDWFDKQSPILQQANSPQATPSDIIMVLDKFKNDTGKLKADKQQAIDAGLTPDVRGGTQVQTQAHGRAWTTAEIDSMSEHEYAKHAEEIDLAFKEGRIS